MFNKGDQVSVLDEAINGVVLSVNDKDVRIETEDGFVMNYTSKELIKINVSNDLSKDIGSFNSSQIRKEKEISQEGLEGEKPTKIF